MFALHAKNLHRHVDYTEQILIPIMSLLPNQGKIPNTADHEKNVGSRGLPY